MLHNLRGWRLLLGGKKKKRKAKKMKFFPTLHFVISILLVTHAFINLKNASSEQFLEEIDCELER